MLIGLGKITSLNLFSAFDPISTALAEFELTDYVFSKIRPLPLPDDRIVLVNIGPDRRAMAEQIRIISQHKPRVIGIDGFFNCEGGLRDTVNCPQLLDTLGNLILANAIQEAGNVVLVTRLLQSSKTYAAHLVDVYDSVEYSDDIFHDAARKNAFANLVTKATYQEDVKVCKSFVPKVMVNGKPEYAFSVNIAMLYDSVKTRKFLARNLEEEIINFRGNFEIPDVKVKSLREEMQATSEFRVLCYAIDWPALLNGDYLPTMFEDKIVILGFLGNYFGDPAWEDKFFTPLNTKVAGRANPDMFGLVVHANIVSMILNGDFVNQLQEWQKVTIAFIITFLNVLLFGWIDRRYPIWFDGLQVLIQVIEILLISILIVFVFAYFNFKLDLTLSIATTALIGPCFDIGKSIEKTLEESGRFKWFTRKQDEVLTS
jgi:CHASE2 domain-containing sensor protein